MIKKIKKNEYLNVSNNIWVRNYTDLSRPNININSFYHPEEYVEILKNEKENIKKYPPFDFSQINKKNILIMSDGYDFENRHKFLYQIPKEKLSIISTNGSLKLWTLVGDKCENNKKRSISYYLVNNPYKESMNFLPSITSYFPNCISSTRTNHEFLNKYRGNIYTYSSIPEKNFSGFSYGHPCLIDDYRNPICAAIIFSFFMRAKKICLFCCDDSFQNEKPSAIKLENGLYCYPQQIQSSKIIDGVLYWAKQFGISILDYSSGLKLKNADYIKNKEEIIDFFED